MSLKSKLSSFTRVVLWGYKTPSHSHHFIHLGYSRMFEDLGIEYLWVDDIPENNQLIPSGSLIMIPDVHLTYGGKSRLSHTFSRDMYYILHPGEHLTPDQVDEIDPMKVVRLYEFRNGFLKRLSQQHRFTEARPFVLYSEASRILLQPWGAELSSNSFMEPIYPTGNEAVFVGSIWGDAEGTQRGNVKKIDLFSTALAKFGINFLHRTNVSVEENIRLVRTSRVSASIGSVGHNIDSYLQCRMFKNISYGQPTLSDVRGFSEIFGDSFVQQSSWEDGVEKILSLSMAQYIDLAKLQQSRMTEYTYERMWDQMISTF